MVMDSLLACLQMSNKHSLKQVSAKTRPASETFIQTQKDTPLSSENTTFVSHMLKQDNWYKKFEKWNMIITQDVLVESNFKETPETGSDKTLKIDQDPISMVEIVQGEIRTLISLAPSVSRTAENLSQWVSHYKECTKCHEKISLLEVLHRIQELNLYISKKRKKTNNRSTQIKQKDQKSVQKLNDQISIKSGSSQQISTGEVKKKQVEKLRIVDPAAIAEGHLGVQILLETDPEEKQSCHWINRVNDNYYPSAVQKPHSTKDKSADVVSPKLHSVALFFASTFFARSPDSVLVLSNPIGVGRARKTSLGKIRKISFINHVYSCERQSLLLTVNFCIVFFKKIGCLSVPETLGQKNKSLLSDESSDSISNSLKDLFQKMESKIMDEEITSLRNLINEIQQNQIKLSKVLLNEGIFSQTLIKLTNPALLDEETRTLKKFSGILNSSTELISFDDLQDILNTVKEKCTFKNRLIGTVIKGLRHNIPTEWWEEIVNYAFEGSHTINEQDYEKVNGLLRQCSSYFKRHEKALEQQSTTERLEERREDERPSGEESNVRDSARASTRDSSKTLSRYEDRASRSSWTFPDIETQRSNQSTMNQQPIGQQSPRENQMTIRDKWMKSLENQISTLSVENTKLWEEIHALRDSVENPTKESNVKKIISVSNNQSLQDIPTGPGKVINVTVQISSDRMARRTKENEILKLRRFRDTAEDGHSRTSKFSVKTSPEYSRRSEHRDPSPSGRSSTSETKAKLHVKSDRGHSQNDLTHLDDFSPSAPEDRQSRYRIIAKEKVVNRESSPIVQQMSVTENPEVYNFLKESESQKSQKAGPSCKSLEIDYLLQRPSLVKLGGSQTSGIQAIMSNERELQPILENDHLDLCTSSSLCQAVQQLRARVRSLQKEVTVLKSKNDRIDKLLDKLLDDAVDNNKSFEEMENNLMNFRRLD